MNSSFIYECARPANMNGQYNVLCHSQPTCNAWPEAMLMLSMTLIMTITGLVIFRWVRAAKSEPKIGSPRIP